MKSYCLYLGTLLFVNVCTASDSMIKMRDIEHEEIDTRSTAAITAFVSSCKPSDNMVKMNDTEHQEEADKKSAATATVFRCDSNKVKLELESERPLQQMKWVLCFDNEKDDYVRTGVSSDMPVKKLDLLLDDHQYVVHLRWHNGQYKYVYKESLYNYFRTFGEQASDYVTEYVGNDKERKVLMDKSAMDKAAPRVIKALLAATAILKEDIADLNGDIAEKEDHYCSIANSAEARTIPLTQAFISCAAHYPHPELLGQLLSLGARVTGMAFRHGGWHVENERYPDVVLPKSHPYAEQACLLFSKHAREEALARFSCKEEIRAIKGGASVAEFVEIVRSMTWGGCVIS